jgi:predicted enzyme related to lactoylglutathione lyase
MKTAFETHGAFSWNELSTTNVGDAREFYGKLFGWKFEDMNVSGMTYAVISAGDTAIGGIMNVPAQTKGMPPTWGAYVTVDNVDDLVARVASLGGKLLVPAQDIPTVGRFAVIQDPQGAVLSVITYLPRS